MKIEIEKLDDLDTLLKVVRQRFESQGHLDVIIKKHDGSVKEEQRGLYWRWMKHICDTTGYTNEQQHEIFKWKFLVGIYQKDTDRHPRFKNIGEMCKTISTGDPEMFKQVKAHILAATSHMDASVQEMREFLNEVEAVAIDLNVKLPASTRKGVR